MSSVYPAALPTYTVKTNKVDLVDAAHINLLQTDVIAIANTLGVNPQGSASDLSTRLLRNILANGSLNHGTSFPVSPNAGDWFFRTDLNVAYIYTGSTWSAQSGITSYVAGTYIIAGPSLVHVGADGSFTKIAEFIIPRGGTLTIAFGFSGSGGGTPHGRIYRNGVAVGTDQSAGVNPAWTDFSEDISGWAAGDLCQIYAYTTAGSYRAGGLILSESVPVREIFSPTFKMPLIYAGSGAPDANMADSYLGSLYLRIDGGASTTLYVKTSAATWSPK